jgi:PAS domain S-box-containing protein
LNDDAQSEMEGGHPLNRSPVRGAARLAAILDALPDALLLVDAVGRVVNANAAALEMFEGESAERLMGKPLVALLPGFGRGVDTPGSGPALLTAGAAGTDPAQAAGAAAAGGPAVPVRARPERLAAQRTDGSVFPAEATATTLPNDEDELTLYVVRDLTGVLDLEGELRRQQRQIELILRAASEGIVGVDDEGRIVLVNPAGARILRHRAGDLGGQDAHELIAHSAADGSPLPPERCLLVDSLRTGVKHRSTDEVLWRSDGTSVTVEMTTAPVYEGDAIIGAVMTFTDNSEVRAAARRARELADVLEDDLRAPLAGVLAELRDLAGYGVGELGPAVRRSLAAATDNLGEVAGLVEDIADYQRLVVGDTPYEPQIVDLAEMVDEAVAAGSANAAALGVDVFGHSAQVDIAVDPDLFPKMLDHLISDLVTASPVGGKVVATAARRGPVARIEIRGPHTGGGPLHLPIARAIAARHGGSVTTHRISGKGNTHVVEVPVEAAGAVASTSPWKAVKRREPRRLEQRGSLGLLSARAEQAAAAAAQSEVGNVEPPGAIETGAAETGLGTTGTGPGSTGGPVNPQRPPRGFFPEPAAPPAAADPHPRQLGLERAHQPEPLQQHVPEPRQVEPDPDAMPEGLAPRGRRAASRRFEDSRAVEPQPIAEPEEPAQPEPQLHPVRHNEPSVRHNEPPIRDDEPPARDEDVRGADRLTEARYDVGRQETGRQYGDLREADQVTSTSERRRAERRPDERLVPAREVEKSNGHHTSHGANVRRPAPGDPDTQSQARIPAQSGRSALSRALDATGLDLKPSRPLPTSDVWSRPSREPSPPPSHFPQDEPPDDESQRYDADPAPAETQPRGRRRAVVQTDVPEDAPVPNPAPSAADSGRGGYGGQDWEEEGRNGYPHGRSRGYGAEMAQPRSQAVSQPAEPSVAPPQNTSTGPGDEYEAEYERGYGRQRDERARDEYGDEYSRDERSRDEHIRDQRSRDERIRDQHSHDQHSRDEYRRDEYNRDDYNRDEYSRDEHRPNRDEYARDEYGRDEYARDEYGREDHRRVQAQPVRETVRETAREVPRDLPSREPAPRDLPLREEPPQAPAEPPRSSLLMWPEPDPSTLDLLTEFGYSPMALGGGRAPGDLPDDLAGALAAAGPRAAAVLVDPISAPITRRGLRALRGAAIEAGLPMLVTAGIGGSGPDAPTGPDPALLLQALTPSAVSLPRVLLVEARHDLAEAMSLALERQGMQVLHAATDVEGIRQAADGVPDVVVMDLMQVRRRRTGIVEWLRDRDRLNTTPIVVYTALGSDSEQFGFSTHGGTLYLAERSTDDEVGDRMLDLLAKLSPTGS